MGRSARRAGARVGTLAFCAVAAVTLSACFAPAPRPAPQQVAAPPTAPPAPPTTTTTTTTLPATAQLAVSPATVSLSAERTDSPPEARRTITVTNTGGDTSGPLAGADLTGLTEPGMGVVATSTFSVADDHCLGQTLAAGANCTFTLVLDVAAYANSAPWTGDLPIAATPGGTAHVSVTAKYTSKLLFEPVTELDASPSLDGTTHFVLQNDGPQDFGPMSFTLVDAGMPGSSAGIFTLSTDPDYGIPPCSGGMTLASGESCQWLVTYSNDTGAEGDTAFLIFDVPGVVHAQAGFNGVGMP